MNILMTHWAWYPTGGDWTYVDGICKMYESKGHQIIPFSVKNKKNIKTPFDKYFLNEVDYKSFYNKISLKSGISTAFNSIYSFEAKRKLNLLLSENKVDIAQFNSITNYHTPSIIPVLKNHKIPIVWRILDYRLICPNSTFLSNDKVCEACFKNRYYNCVTKRCKKNSLLASTLLALESYTYSFLPFYEKVDMFLFQSEFTRDIFVKFGFDIKKTHIIENSYDYSNIKPIYNGENYILYFGRISKEKGIKTLIDSMRNLPEIQIKIVGDGPQLEEYKKYSSEKMLSNVTFLGPKWGSELKPIIEKSEFVILPSEWYDPSPYVVLQSFSYGKPVIASNIGGLKDLIINNENGLLFEPGNSNELSESIKKLIIDKKLIKKMGENARRILEYKNNPKRYYSNTMEVFNNLINQNNKI
jgi:glycosyltransferase involved in cell wall biosynthesis